jgi:hypothetical protein
MTSPEKPPATSPPVHESVGRYLTRTVLYGILLGVGLFVGRVLLAVIQRNLQ